jgi:serine/threonine protein kinase/WD40 repeat protein
MADLSGRILGDYILREKIGDGGYGDVYRAEHRLLKRVAVVKVLNEDLQCSHHAKVRFLREAQLASKLRHPYAAHVYDFGVADEDGSLWIAMEYVEGVTLGAWLAKHGPMGLEEFVPFFECMAEAVHAAHTAGIVHRDLKPSNVMVMERRGLLVPKLLDFGIAKGKVAPLVEDEEPINASGDDKVITALMQATARITRTGSAVGSRPYMSPEQWGNASGVGPPADVYSLGIMVYEALTGRLPFPAESTDEFFQYHCHATVPALGGSFSQDLDRVLFRALAKVPWKRHGTALELAADLRAVLQADPREQIRSWARRWHERRRSPDLLARGQVLKDIERYVHRVGEEALSDLECSFVVHSRQLARRIRWFLRSLVALAAVVVVGVAAMQLRSARQLAEVTVTQSELAQGQSALLHGEPEALPHLAEAYKRGERSESTKFMLARAVQPRLAEQARFTSTSGRMWSATFSPDGRQIVTTDDRSAQVWDAQTYRMLFGLPHGTEVYHAVYSADGQRLVTAAQDAIRIWDATSGALVRALTQKRNDRKLDYYIAAISFDGRLVAAIDVKGAAAHVWDVVTGAQIAELPNDASGFPGLTFSSDGRWLAATGGKEVHVFDTSTWAQVCSIPRVRRLAFDPTGARLVTGSIDGDASIWEIPSGTRIRRLREFGEAVDAVAVSPDGRLVVAASRDGAVQIWHAGSGELQSQFNPRHSRILAVEFDRTSKLTLAAGSDGTVVVADVALGMPVTVLEGPQNDVRVAHFDPDSRRVVGASRDGTARVWDATAPYRRWSSPPMSDDCGLISSPEPDRRVVAVRCGDHVTRVWDTARDQLIAELPSVSHVEDDFTSAFPVVSPAGDRVAIARGTGVEVYELPSRRLLRTIAQGAPVNVLAFATTGGDLVSGGVDGSLLVARDNGALLALPSSPGGIDATAFLPDGRVVASDAQRRLRVYDRVGTVLADLELPGRVMSLRINGTLLVTVPICPGSAAPPVLLDLESYRIIAQLAGHVGQVLSARWVAGGRILTAGGDGTARLWDGATGQLRQVYRGSSRFSPTQPSRPAASSWPVALTVCSGSGTRPAGNFSGRCRWISRLLSPFMSMAPTS